MSKLRSRWQPLAMLYAGICVSLYGVDGVVLIDQNRALAGGVTPGDAPGFPVTISQPGSYKLSGNLTVPDANTDAIVVNASFVTIDLNGFSILGPTVCLATVPVSCSPTGTGRGVKTGNGPFRATTVSYGSISGMGLSGVFLGGNDSIIEKIHVEQNGGDGMSISAGIVRDNTSLLNGGNGMTVFRGVISGNSVLQNGKTGIQVEGCPSSVIGNAAGGNFLGDISVPAAPGCVAANNAAGF